MDGPRGPTSTYLNLPQPTSTHLNPPQPMSQRISPAPPIAPDATTIEALRFEAGGAGDYEMVQRCDMVLYGEYYFEQGDDESIVTATDAQIAEAVTIINDALQTATDSNE